MRKQSTLKHVKELSGAVIFGTRVRFDDPPRIESMPQGTTSVRLDSSGTKLAVETVDHYQEVRVIENLLPVIEVEATRIRPRIR